MSFKKGDVIFHQGDEANEAYFVERGECAIVLERPAPIAEDDNACKACGCDTSMCVHTVVAVRGPGEMVGEMALVYRNVNLAEEPARRTASMVARTDLVLYRLSQEQFARDMSANDECRTRLIDLVTERTRETADFKRRNSGEKNSLDNADNDVDSNELIVALQEYKDSSSSSASSSYERSRNNSLESRNSAGAVGSDAAGDEAQYTAFLVFTRVRYATGEMEQLPLALGGLRQCIMQGGGGARPPDAIATIEHRFPGRAATILDFFGMRMGRPANLATSQGPFARNARKGKMNI